MACPVLVAAGTAWLGHSRKRPGATAVLELVVGGVLLLLALRLHRRPERTQPAGGASQRLLDRLAHLHRTTACVAGVALGVGGPKRLVLTGLAAATITAAGTGRRGEAALVLWYTALATAIVWIPVGAAVVVGERAVDALDAGFRWLTAHRRPVTVAVLVVVGCYLVADALLLLAA